MITLDSLAEYINKSQNVLKAEVVTDEHRLNKQYLYIFFSSHFIAVLDEDWALDAKYYKSWLDYTYNPNKHDGVQFEDLSEHGMLMIILDKILESNEDCVKHLNRSSMLVEMTKEALMPMQF